MRCAHSDAGWGSWYLRYIQRFNRGCERVIVITVNDVSVTKIDVSIAINIINIANAIINVVNAINAIINIVNVVNTDIANVITNVINIVVNVNAITNINITIYAIIIVNAAGIGVQGHKFGNTLSANVPGEPRGCADISSAGICSIDAGTVVLPH